MYGPVPPLGVAGSNISEGVDDLVDHLVLVDLWVGPVDAELVDGAVDLPVATLEVQSGDVADQEKWPTLAVDRSCTQLSWECREGWRWPEHKSEVRTDSETPLDKDNHGLLFLNSKIRYYNIRL